MQSYKKLFLIVSNVLNSEPYNELSITEDEWKEIFSLAKRHDILIFLEFYISKYKTKTNIPKDIVNYLENNYRLAIAKSLNQIHTAKLLQEKFEDNGIYNIFIKGINTKNRYPDQILRTMGDLDILYKGNQSQKVKNILLNEGFGDFRHGRMHDSYKKPPYISLEMHRTLVAGDSEFFDYYKNIWDKCKLKQDKKFTYEMSLEDEFIYNIIHLIEHFKIGGIGIRFVIDIYIYNHIPSLNKEYLIQQFKELKILEFYNNISNLAEYWFCKSHNHEPDFLPLGLENYILSGGLFGTSKNTVNSKLRKGKINFALKVCFPSLNEMKSMYSWLNKFPFLLPISWLIRGGDAIFNRRDSISTQFAIYKTDNIDNKKSLDDFYSKCGL